MYVEQTIAELGRIDGLYNNAGIEGKQDPIEAYDAEMLDKVLAVNSRACWTMKHTPTHFKSQGSGAIVTPRRSAASARCRTWSPTSPASTRSPA